MNDWDLIDLPKMLKNSAQLRLGQFTALILGYHLKTKFLRFYIEVIFFLLFDLKVEENLPDEIGNQGTCQNSKRNKSYDIGFKDCEKVIGKVAYLSQILPIVAEMR